MEILTPIINVIISGVILGSLYAVMSMGLTLIYGVGRIFNFAQGVFVLWGGYFAWLFSVKLEFNYWLSIIIALILTFVMGWAVDRGLLYPLRKLGGNYHLTALIVTLGLALVLSNAGDVIFGTRYKTIDELSDGLFRAGDFAITYHDLAILVISIGILISLELFLRKTTVGTALRAISQDPEGAKIVGINLERLFALTMALAALLGGASGVLLAPKFFIAPEVGWETLMKAVIIVIFGGLGSITGTLVSAFILGLLEAFVSMYMGMFYVSPMWFILLIIVLFIKPRGLLGKWA